MKKVPNIQELYQYPRYNPHPSLGTFYPLQPWNSLLPLPLLLILLLLLLLLLLLPVLEFFKPLLTGSKKNTKV